MSDDQSVFQRLRKLIELDPEGADSFRERILVLMREEPLVSFFEVLDARLKRASEHLLGRLNVPVSNDELRQTIGYCQGITDAMDHWLTLVEMCDHVAAERLQKEKENAPISTRRLAAQRLAPHRFRDIESPAG